MAKKIYDIKPPKLAKKKEEAKEKVNSSVQIKHVHTAAKKQQTVRRNKKEKVSVWWPVSIGIFVVLLVVCVYLFFKLPKVDVVIWPKVNTLSFQQTITADKSAIAVDNAKNVIPAQYFQATKTESQDFPATGSSSDGGLASGTITIYNKYSPAKVFTFKAGTHFMSDSGKLFVALQKISIPAATKSGGTINPGSVKIQVQAVAAGDGYNIAPSNFSIPGLNGTPYFYSVYATSSVTMAGGSSGKVKEVTDDDIQSAKDVLTKKVTADALANLNGQISSDYILPSNAISSIVTGASTPTKSGTTVDTFTYSVTVKAGALAFKKSDLNQFAQNYVNSQMPAGDTFLANSLKTDYVSPTVDISGGKATLNLNISSGAYQSIDKNSITLSLLGENASQISKTINDSLAGGVSKIQINFWPFWVTSAPASQGAINVQLKFQ